MALHCPSKI